MIFSPVLISYKVTEIFKFSIPDCNALLYVYILGCTYFSMVFLVTVLATSYYF